MASVRANVIESTDIVVTPRQLDFVTRFERNWQHMRDIMGITRMIRKQPGATIRYKYATGQLATGTGIGEGAAIPNSHYTVAEKPIGDIEIEKYAKEVSLEAIAQHGYADAVQLTDDEFLFDLTTNVTSKFYTFLNGGTLTATYKSFQMGLAMAKGLVEDRFKQMHRNVTNVVGFVNTLDVYEYLGTAQITVQNEFGFQYIKNFMGYSTIFMLSSNEIARGKIIALPVENIVNYYVDPSDSDFSRADLHYTTSAAETNLIGVATKGDYDTATTRMYAIMGMLLMAEYIDAIAVVTVNPAASTEGITSTGSGSWSPNP